MQQVYTFIMMLFDANKGSSKTYVTARGGGGRRFFYIYPLLRVLYGRRMCFWNSYVTAHTQFENLENPT